MKALVERLPVFSWHAGSIHPPRVERIAKALADMAGGPAEALLDIGSGDGRTTLDVAARVGATRVQGVDVKVRPTALVETKAYDGLTLPFPSATFDLVMIADVLHHAESPRAVVGEALRVLRPGGSLVVKDHIRHGAVSGAVLLAMDIVGNYAPGVDVRGNYLSLNEWVDLVRDAGGRIDRIAWPLDIHDLPWRLVARSEYQFAMRVRPVSTV